MSIRIGVINNVIQEEGANALAVAADLGFEGVEYFVPAPWDHASWLDISFQQTIRDASRDAGVNVPSLALAYLNRYLICLSYL